MADGGPAPLAGKFLKYVLLKMCYIFEKGKPDIIGPELLEVKISDATNRAIRNFTYKPQFKALFLQKSFTKG